MSNWDHEGHDRRRGDVTALTENLATHFVCITCKVIGMTTQDISDWAKWSDHDYYSNIEWCDPEAYEWYKEQE